MVNVTRKPPTVMQQNLDTDAALQVYAGRNYAEPKKLVADSIDFSDYITVEALVDALVAFKAKHSDCAIVPTERDVGEWSNHQSGFRAERMETAAEVETRIAGYKVKLVQDLARRQEQKRADYERLKQEFGDF